MKGDMDVRKLVLLLRRGQHNAVRASRGSGAWPYVQARVQSTYKKFSKTRASSGIPANEMARQLLQNANSGVSITQVRGYLTDHFNPKTHTVGLSDAVYHSDSIAALAVAAP